MKITKPVKKIGDRSADETVDIINVLKRYDLLKKGGEHTPHSLLNKVGKKAFENY